MRATEFTVARMGTHTHATITATRISQLPHQISTCIGGGNIARRLGCARTVTQESTALRGLWGGCPSARWCRPTGVVDGNDCYESAFIRGELKKFFLCVLGALAPLREPSAPGRHGNPCKHHTPTRHPPQGRHSPHNPYTSTTCLCGSKPRRRAASASPSARVASGISVTVSQFSQIRNWLWCRWFG